MKKLLCTNCNHRKIETLFETEKKTKRFVYRLGRETISRWCLKCVDNPIAYLKETKCDAALKAWRKCHPVVVNRNIDEKGELL
jgi:hypothetical protein